MGKGKRQGQVGDQQLAYAKKEQGIQDTARNADTPFLNSLIPGASSATAGAGGAGAAGGVGGPTPSAAMSPYAAAQYGSDVENVNRVYGNLRQGAYKALGATGFGNAPSGREASMLNTLNEGKGEQLTSAYRGGLANTLSEGLTASNAMEGRQSMYNPNNAYSGATSSYAASDAARGAQFNGIVNDALGVAGAATGFAGMMKGNPTSPTNFGSLPGGSATNTAPLPLGSMGSAMSLAPGMMPSPSSNGAGGAYAAPTGGFKSKYATSGPALWSGA